MSWQPLTAGESYTAGTQYRSYFLYPSDTVVPDIATPKDITVGGYGIHLSDFRIDSALNRVVIDWNFVSPSDAVAPEYVPLVNPYDPTVRTEGGYVKQSSVVSASPAVPEPPSAFAVPVVGIVAGLIALGLIYLTLDRSEKLVNDVSSSPTWNLALLAGVALVALYIWKQFHA